MNHSANRGPKRTREQLLARVSDILRRSGVEEAEEIVRELERRIGRDPRRKRRDVSKPRVVTASDVRAAARWDAMGAVARRYRAQRSCHHGRAEVNRTQRMSDSSTDGSKLAFTLWKEASAILGAMEKDKDGAAYHASARNFNELRKRARDVLQHDPTIADTIEHVPEYNADLVDGWHSDYQKMKIDLAYLVGSLDSFIAQHMPPKERERIGFDGKPKSSPKRSRKR